MKTKNITLNSSEWKTKEVFEEHGYDKDIAESCEHHDEFVDFLIKNNIKSPKILDIGCCNGRVINSFEKLNHDFAVYHGLDINPYAIDLANKHWKNKKGVSFEVFDVVKRNISELPLRAFDVVYLDSTLSWLPNWRELLDILIENVDIVYCNRTIWMTDIYLDCEDSKLKRMHPEYPMKISFKWSGMKDYAQMDFINEGYIDILCDKHQVVCFRYKEDSIDGNWFDFNAYGIPLSPSDFQQCIELICNRTWGLAFQKDFMKNYWDENVNIMKTGKGVWFKPTKEVAKVLNEHYPHEKFFHGGYCSLNSKDGLSGWEACSLTSTKNRKLIFVPADERNGEWII